jgi:hypothetical protein
MAAVASEPKPGFFIPALYALSGFVLACARYYLPYEQRSPVAQLILFSPLLFLVPFARLLLLAATKRQKLWAVLLNGVFCISVAGYVANRPFWPPTEIPFETVVILAVTVPAAFMVAVIAIFIRHKSAYSAGLVASLLIWPCLLLNSLTQRSVGPYGLASLGAIVAVLGFVIAAFVLFVTPNIGYGLGLVSAALAWPYLVIREMSYPYYGNSWTMFNVPVDPTHGTPELTYAKLTILSVAIVVASTFSSLLRLWPPSWEARAGSIRSRHWPIFAGSFVVMAAWFVHSVTPYRVPTEHHGVSAEISVVHFERRGLHLRETRVAVFRDGKLFVCSDIREPLRYRSNGECSSGAVPLDRWGPIVDLVRSSKFQTLGSSRRQIPRGWDSDTWYVHGHNAHLVAFNSAENVTPPKEIVDWFNEMSKIPRGDDWHFSTRDICLGLCYQPQL